MSCGCWFLSMQGSDALSMNRAFAHMKLPKPGKTERQVYIIYNREVITCVKESFSSVESGVLSLWPFVGVRSVCAVTV